MNSDSKEWRFMAIQVCGIMIIAISILALIGYLIDMEMLTDWQSDHSKGGMAIPTAVCFLSIGTAFLLLPCVQRCPKCSPEIK